MVFDSWMEGEKGRKMQSFTQLGTCQGPHGAAQVPERISGTRTKIQDKASSGTSSLKQPLNKEHGIRLIRGSGLRLARIGWKTDIVCQQ